MVEKVETGKKVIGKKQNPVSIIDLETGNPLNAKQSAEYISTLLTDLTKNYLEVSVLCLKYLRQIL